MRGCCYALGMEAITNLKFLITLLTRRSLSSLLIIVLISSFSTISVADSFRCAGKVIRSGDSSGTVVQKCGEPRFKDRGYEKIRVSGKQKKARVERWHYKKSSRSLGRVVMIYKGHVVAIETGDR